MSTWTLASSQATNSPFIQMRSAGLHVGHWSPRARRARPARPRRCSRSRRGPRVRRPACSARSTADSRPPRPRRPSRGRAGASSRPTGTSPAGWRSPARRCPAPSRARARTGPACRRSPSDALGQHADRAGEHRRLVAEDVAEHVLGDDHVEVRAGAETSCIAALSTSTCSSSMCGNSRACTSLTTSRHSRRGLQHVGLVDARHLRRAAAPEGDARDPLDLRDACRRRRRRRGRRCASSRRSRCRR